MKCFILFFIPLFVLLLCAKKSFSTKITGYLCTNGPKAENKLVCDNIVEADSRFYSCDFNNFTYGRGNELGLLRTGGCRGSTLDPKIPELFPNLNFYDISNHGIETITSEDLRFNHLVGFTAPHNKLTSIPAGLFKYITNTIWQIDLEFNNITSFEKDALSEVGEETIISLQNNPLRRIDGKIFLPIHFRNTHVSITWENVEEFDISNMSGIFNFGHSFDALAIGKQVDRSTYRSIHYTKDNFVNLKVFNASHTAINDIVKIIELLGSSLEVLDVTSSSISELNVGIFNRFKNLQQLILSNMNLKVVDFHGFNNRASLKVLDLSYNNLNGIDFAQDVGVFENLETLNLKGNKVGDIPDIFPKLSNLEMSFRIESNSTTD